MNPNNNPYYLTIVTTEISDHDPEGYKAYRKELSEIMSEQPGFKGAEAVVEGTTTISLVYWETQEAMSAWGSAPAHQEIKKKSHAGGWLKSARIEIAQVNHCIEMPPK
ncbi:MAG: antibiotic biosynthesis monooxygenase [SAR324 cluster bacterium]|nr:antibiotic biosynthesis monooxygenase [SAR324 cluster bacterium]